MSREEQPANREETTVTITAEAPATTKTPDVIRGDIVSTGRRGIKAQLVTILGEDFLRYGDGFYSVCGNCDGGYSGHKSAYAGVFAGECFQCLGTGHGKKVGDDEQDVIKRAKARVAARERRARKAREAAEAEQKVGADWRAANPEVADLGEAVYAEMAEAGYDGHVAVSDRWGDRVIHLANLVGMGRALTAAETAELPVAIAKALDERAAEQAAWDAQKYLGETGDVVTVTGAVAANIPVETRYGWTRLLIVEGTGEFTGVTLKLWSTAKAVREAERGDVVTVTGTVKTHEEYDGVKQTELGKAKVTAR